MNKPTLLILQASNYSLYQRQFNLLRYKMIKIQWSLETETIRLKIFMR